MKERRLCILNLSGKGYRQVRIEGHETKLNMNINNHLANHNYSKEELIVKIGAGFLCSDVRIGDHTIQNSASHIKSWINVLKSDNKIVIQSVANVQKAVEFIKGCDDK